jgi:hypothetical protein
MAAAFSGMVRTGTSNTTFTPYNKGRGRVAAPSFLILKS